MKSVYDPTKYDRKILWIKILCLQIVLFEEIDNFLVNGDIILEEANLKTKNAKYLVNSRGKRTIKLQPEPSSRQQKE